MQTGWSKLRQQVLDIDDLWFRRMNALVAKYALVEWIESNQQRVQIEIPDLLPSFGRILAHVRGTLVEEDLKQRMIKNKYGYPYKTKATSVEYVYTNQDKLGLFDEFCRLCANYKMSLKHHVFEPSDH